MTRQPVLPVSAQAIDDTGHPWALLSEATDRSAVYPGAVLVVGHPDDPLLARVLDVTPEDDDHVVHVEVFGPVAAVERAIHVA
jgi:acyl-CoA reductase-like NAD-dependent aldehyde dehydrogenase